MQAYAAAGQTQYAMSNLRWVADYFVKCHYSDVLFAGQVGDVGTDHGIWVQAEALPTYRPSFFISPSSPGVAFNTEMEGVCAHMTGRVVP